MYSETNTLGAKLRSASLKIIAFALSLSSLSCKPRVRPRGAATLNEAGSDSIAKVQDLLGPSRGPIHATPARNAPISMLEGYRGEENGQSPLLDNQRTIYLTASERDRLKITFDGGIVSKKSGGWALELLYNHSEAMIVQSTDGTIYSGLQAGVGSQYKHSSFLAGADVLFAGNIQYKSDGYLKFRITYVDNDSGHYAPNPGKLRIFLESLQAAGVDLSNVTVGIRGNLKQLVKLPASVFLAAVPEYCPTQQVALQHVLTQSKDKVVRKVIVDVFESQKIWDLFAARAALEDLPAEQKTERLESIRKWMAESEKPTDYRQQLDALRQGFQTDAEITAMLQSLP